MNDIRQQLNTLSKLLDAMNERVGSGKPIEGTQDYIRRKTTEGMICVQNLSATINPSPAPEPSSSSRCSCGLERPWEILACKQQYSRCSMKGRAIDVSSLSGPDRERLQAGGPASTSRTPATPEDASPEFTTSPESKNSRPRAHIYVAGPYWHPNEKLRHLHREIAKLFAVRLVEQGFFPITPHLNTGGFEDLIHMPESFYHKGDIRLLESCDAVLLLPNWQHSTGTKAEREHAIHNNIPIFNTLEDLEIQYA